MYVPPPSEVGIARVSQPFVLWWPLAVRCPVPCACFMMKQFSLKNPFIDTGRVLWGMAKTSSLCSWSPLCRIARFKSVHHVRIPQKKCVSRASGDALHLRVSIRVAAPRPRAPLAEPDSPGPGSPREGPVSLELSPEPAHSQPSPPPPPKPSPPPPAAIVMPPDTGRTTSSSAGVAASPPRVLSPRSSLSVVPPAAVVMSRNSSSPHPGVPSPVTHSPGPRPGIAPSELGTPVPPSLDHVPTPESPESLAQRMSPTVAPSVHYVVLQHGMEAVPGELQRLKQCLEQVLGGRAVVLLSPINEGATLDGVVAGGWRLADYVRASVPQVCSVSGRAAEGIGWSVRHCSSELFFLEAWPPAELGRSGITFTCPRVRCTTRARCTGACICTRLRCTRVKGTRVCTNAQCI